VRPAGAGQPRQRTHGLDVGEQRLALLLDEDPPE
jgi:hypothetical protein